MPGLDRRALHLPQPGRGHDGAIRPHAAHLRTTVPGCDRVSLPIEYVHALRIEEAKRILELETGSIDEVGYVVGYEDPTFFRRLFKRRTGLTPAAYRRKYADILDFGAARARRSA